MIGRLSHLSRCFAASTVCLRVVMARLVLHRRLASAPVRRGLVAVLATFAGTLLLLPGSAPGAAEEGGGIVVFAAASLKPPLDEIAQDWRDATGEEVLVNYGGSGLLAQQIARGAPADLFLSADPLWVERLADEGLVMPGNVRTLLSNRLVLIAPAGAASRLDDPRDLPAFVGDGPLVIGNPASVPAGRYAKETLEALGVWQDFQGRLAFTENVRVALAYVVRGEAPAAIVYASDAQDRDDVTLVRTFAADLHTPIVYEASLVGDSVTPRARRLFDHLAGAEAAAVFAAHGFEPADAASPARADR